MTQVKRANELTGLYRPLVLDNAGKYRYSILIKYKQLRAKGFSEPEALKFLEVKRSTYYSWLKRYNSSCGSIRKKAASLCNKSRRPHHFRRTKVITHELISHIYKIRQVEKMYGKEKIKRELEKAGIEVSVSTVGRVLKYLMEKRKIQSVRTLIRKSSRYRSPHKRERYAERIGKQKSTKPGELIQIDHMVLNLYNGLRIKEFRAVDPLTKISISRIYSEATSKNAKEFLKEVIKNLEFEIKSIQVDGGSEFMADFEDYCEAQGIKLYVLPPRSPKMNGIVERTNATYRYEFWNVYDLPDTIEETRKLLRKFELKYNFERMHQSLNYLTPMEYYNKLVEQCA